MGLEKISFHYNPKERQCQKIVKLPHNFGGAHGPPLQFCYLENPRARGAWWAAVPGVPKSRTRLSGFTFTFHFHALEKEMATHSSVLAWRILAAAAAVYWLIYFSDYP